MKVGNVKCIDINCNKCPLLNRVRLCMSLKIHQQLKECLNKAKDKLSTDNYKKLVSDLNKEV